MTYDAIATASQVTSLLLFVGMFAAVLAYALWPRNGPRFEAAQRRALDLDHDQGRGMRVPGSSRPPSSPGGGAGKHRNGDKAP